MRRMKRVVKVLTVTASVVALIALVLVTVVLVRWNRTFEAPYPKITASKDPKVIARGRYIAYGPGHCAACHTDSSKHKALDEGQLVPLSGGLVFELPLGKFYTPNLTPHPTAGIGRRKDAEIARILRYGVRADGRAALPFMEFHDMSDDDLQAVISFLRSQPQVNQINPQHSFTLMGKAIMAFVIKPIGPKSAPPAVAPAEAPTVERGQYIANNVAGCVSCHTKRSPVDGSYTGPRFAGGMVMDNEATPGTILVTPNLTPDPRTGRIASWPEEQFVGRFGAGVGIPGTHMPWKMYQKMSPTDVQAVYRYLRSLQPIENATGPSVQPKDAKKS
jgi:mono/diheme cytochrome c family protein